MAVALAGAIVAAGTSIYKGVEGAKQKRDAKKALRELDEPEMSIPSAVLSRAYEPVATEFVSAQQEGIERRTAQSLDTLKSAGARGILGNVGRVADAERMAERNLYGQLEQERRSALGELGRAQRDLQERKMRNYLSKVQAIQGLATAGDQNIGSAISDVSQLGQQAVGIGLMEEYRKKYGTENTIDIDYEEVPNNRLGSGKLSNRF